ncbi:putative rRNA large subunit m3Psi methyltransferase RlmH [[Eubacterium] yurii subsp. margaretiae ATCC 43715]|nr:putative rRNA large subunit m3Psi methyltransferase RlmH [[Eubacterium] yurii subsp. margaretiae ATCC 43715]
MPKKNIDLICVGQLKSKIFSDLEKQLLKKIRPQYKVNIIEIKDEKNINIDREKEVEKIKRLEGEKILSKIKKSSYVITLEIGGKQVKNLSFQDLVDNIEKDDITIIIGGSVGLYHKVSEKADKKISISKLTFPHQLVRLLILEQFSL